MAIVGGECGSSVGICERGCEHLDCLVRGRFLATNLLLCCLGSRCSLVGV